MQVSKIQGMLTGSGLSKKRLQRGQWLFWVLTVGLLLRLGVAFSSEQILHPDEVFQYLEQGHRMVYGYGYIPWEYRFGIRSWILPSVIATLLAAARLLGLDQPQGYIPLIQGLTCLASLSVIAAAYYIGRGVASESVGRVASVLACGWHELITVAHKATPEIFGGYLLMVALACLVMKPNLAGSLLLGACCAAAIALRLQYLPPAGLVALMACWWWRRDLRSVALAAMSFCALILAAGWVDYYTWGSWFASYYNNYLYNKVYGVSTLWGEQSLGFYLLHLATNSGGLFLAAIAYGFWKRPRPWPLLVLALSVIGSHSLIAHKEYRFIFGAIPLCLLLLAILLCDLQQWVQRRKGHSWAAILAGGLTLYSGAGILVNTALLSRADSLQAYLYLNRQSDLNAVLNLHSHWFSTGGYYYLHRDVPIYFPGDLEAISPDSLTHFVSHIVCAKDYPPIPGFETTVRFDQAEVRANSTPGPYKPLDIDTRNPIQWGVDDVYKPAVTPRF